MREVPQDAKRPPRRFLGGLSCAMERCPYGRGGPSGTLQGRRSYAAAIFRMVARLTPSTSALAMAPPPGAFVEQAQAMV